ncbi:MAG: hypothetical protein GY883_22160, partial [Shimia sp.]|nr:hypothetical protein [Shimia sp.]
WEGDTSFSNTGVTIDINGFSSFLGGQSSVTNVEGIYLTTGGGNDNITGHQTASLQDKVTTGAGHDQIKLWLGNWDTIDGGAGGSDRLIVINGLGDAYGGVTLSNTTALAGGGYSGMVDGFSVNNVTFTNIEHFTYQSSNTGADYFRAVDGNDLIESGGGDDQLFTGGGSDTIDGGTGNDRWTGDLQAQSSAFMIDINGVSNLVGGGTLRNVEGLGIDAGQGNDTLTGHRTSAMNDTISGHGGNDQIKLWLGGWDTVQGGDGGQDRLILINELDPSFGGVTLNNTS